jgi:hypothetical protein
MVNKTCIDKKDNSLVYTITNEESRRSVIFQLLSHKYSISYKKKGRRTSLVLDFKKKY